ncbi:MAG: hypothetical protein LBN96_08770 [Desulfovibrio sp.]|jgi:uncharacterized protein HemX|nr:hypothetical protein [Desulfovibrio sp.]
MKQANGSMKRAVKGPVAAGFLLLLALAFCLYWLHVVNMRQKAEAGAALRRQSERTARLREEKSLLESLLEKNPCEIKLLLPTTMRE